MTRHPLHHAPIRTFVGDTGAIALIGSGYPYFEAPSEIEAYIKADRWRDEQVTKHEAAFVRRQQAAAGRKARAA